MKLKLSAITLLVFSLLVSDISAQLSQGGQPRSFQLFSKGTVQEFVTDSVDHAEMLAEDEAEGKLGVPQRFGYAFDVNYSIFNSGTWQTLSDGTKIWRLRIKSPGAYSINLIYDEFYLPEGVRFFIFSEDMTMVIGAFTSDNNKEHMQFATGPVKGETIILELNVPAKVSHPGILSVSKVVHAYRNLYDKIGFGSSGSCNINVNCPEGDPWQEEINSVVMVILGNGTRWCSGVMINNTREDLMPYMLTAQHCLASYQNWIIMFNYQSPNCNNTNGPTYMTVHGTSLLASNAYSDFALMELSEPPPDSFNIFYSGWSALDIPADNSVTIHHPAGDIKKISFNHDPVTSTGYLSTQYGISHWMIDDWEEGTTEGGSSGSPLYNPEHRIIGQLHGGYADCNTIEQDWYGKFSTSWDFGSTPTTRLRDWLDPDNTGIMELDGIDANGLTFSSDVQFGFIPLSVNFISSSKIPVDSWNWDFGNGSFSNLENPSTVYQNPGIYDVTLEATSGETTFSRTKQKYIIAIADTLKGSNVSGTIGSSVEMIIEATNSLPARRFIIPIEYSGALPLKIDSFSTAGCRTDYFNNVNYSHYDTFYGRVTINVENNDALLPDLDPGTGPILKVYFTIKFSAQQNDTTMINLDGYTSGPLVFLPTFALNNVIYHPADVSGSMTLDYTPCCVGIRGNVNNDIENSLDIEDLVYLVEYQFDQPPGPAPYCDEEADVDASGDIDIGDIVYLVEYMFAIPSGPAPLDCP